MIYETILYTACTLVASTKSHPLRHFHVLLRDVRVRPPDNEFGDFVREEAGQDEAGDAAVGPADKAVAAVAWKRDGST